MYYLKKKVLAIRYGLHYHVKNYECMEHSKHSSIKSMSCPMTLLGKRVYSVFQRIYLIGFADNVSIERQYKSYCLISDESDSWKCALDYCSFLWSNMIKFSIRSSLWSCLVILKFLYSYFDVSSNNSQTWTLWKKLNKMQIYLTNSPLFKVFFLTTKFFLPLFSPTPKSLCCYNAQCIRYVKFQW